MQFILFGALYLFYLTISIEAGLIPSVSSVTRILGGDSVSIERYPYQISMRWDYGNGRTAHFCGGSIVSTQHIVTAAHCVNKKLNRLNQVKVFTGTSRSNAGGTAHGIKSIKVHPKYIGEANFHLNDIAIVTLSEPIKFSSTQKAVSLPTEDIKNGATATITGWGDTYRNSATPIHLQKATMKLLVSSQCQQRLPFTLANTQVCATTRPGYGVCSGDSGGPLVSNRVLVGVASYVVECGSGEPEVYTNVYSFVDFIKKTIKSK